MWNVFVANKDFFYFTSLHFELKKIYIFSKSSHERYNLSNQSYILTGKVYLKLGKVFYIIQAKAYYVCPDKSS